MPEKKTLKAAWKDAEEGKTFITQRANLFAKRWSTFGKGSTKAQRARVKLLPPKKGRPSEATRLKAECDYQRGQKVPNAKPSPKRSQATEAALKREARSAASPKALSKQAKQAASARKRRGKATGSKT